jgi:hypothetical protein
MVLEIVIRLTFRHVIRISHFDVLWDFFRNILENLIWELTGEFIRNPSGFRWLVFMLVAKFTLRNALQLERRNIELGGHGLDRRVFPIETICLAVGASTEISELDACLQLALFEFAVPHCYFVTRSRSSLHDTRTLCPALAPKLAHLENPLDVLKLPAFSESKCIWLFGWKILIR